MLVRCVIGGLNAGRLGERVIRVEKGKFVAWMVGREPVDRIIEVGRGRAENTEDVLVSQSPDRVGRAAVRQHDQVVLFGKWCRSICQETAVWSEEELRMILCDKLRVECWNESR